MTSHVARLYAAAVGIVVFFVAWAAIAAHPWTTPKPDPRIAALTAREHRIRAESVAVKRVLAKRWAAYRIAAAARKKTIAARQAALAAAPVASASPSVRVVTLPALTITRTS
ncbi:MAG TPA: hypothetical protein VLN26_11725 [Gaiellaceae bacterium]|nr:hypothetical protein [Gaiellaceae bacterium]